MPGLADLAGFEKKWNSIQQTTGLSTEALQPLIRQDVQRVRSGGKPLGIAETLDAARAGSTIRFTQTGPFTSIGGQAIAPAPHQGFWGNLKSDIRAFGAGLNPFHLIPSVIHEFTSAPSGIGTAIAKAETETSPWKAIGDVLQAPLIRMIPGTYTAGNILEGHPGELAKHPLFTFLDVLPGLDKTAEAAGFAGIRQALGVGTAEKPGLLVKAEQKAVALVAAKHPLWAMDMKAYMPSTLWLMHLKKKGALTLTAETQANIQAGLQKYAIETRAWADGLGMDEKEMQHFIEGVTIKPENMLHFSAKENLAYWQYAKRLSDLQMHYMENDQLFAWKGKMYSQVSEPELFAQYKRYQRFNAKWEEANRLVSLKPEDIAHLEGKARTAMLNKVRKAHEQFPDLVKKKTEQDAKIDKLISGQPSIAADPKLGIKGQRFRRSIRTAAETPQLVDETKSRLVEILKGNMEEGDRLNEMINYVMSGDYERAREFLVPKGSKKPYSSVVAAVQKDVRRTQDKFAELGVAPPLFIHLVGPRAIEEMEHPHVVKVPGTESFLKKRTMMEKPSNPALALGLTGMYYEFITKERVTNMWDTMRQTDVIRDGLKVRDDIANQVRLMGLEGHSAAIARMKLLNAHWVKVSTDSAFGKLLSKSGVKFTGDEYIPKALAKDFERMAKPAGTLQKFFGAPMNIFRASVITLSPNYYLHIGISQALMLSLQTSPLALVRHASQAIEMIRTGQVPAELIRTWAGLPEGTKLEALGKGGMYYRLGDEAGVWDRLKQLFSPEQGSTFQAAKTGLDKLHGFSDMVNQFYQTVAYLEGHDKALTKGMGEQEARLAGLTLARKIFGNWGAMTPFERQIIKNVFPFYGFAKTILQYAVSLPFDHPLRVAIITHFGQAEIQDMGSGFAEQFQKMMFFGAPDSKGRVWGLSGTGIDPFANLADMMTMAGLLQRANPEIRITAQLLGINTFSASPDLHPQTHYDAVSGKLVADRPSPWGLISSSFIPQLSGITDMVGMSAQMKKLHDTNYEAWKRQLFSNLGLRFIPTRYDPYAIIESAEKQRYTQFKQLLDQVLAGKNPDVSGYPQLQAIEERVRARASATTP